MTVCFRVSVLRTHSCILSLLFFSICCFRSTRIMWSCFSFCETQKVEILKNVLFVLCEWRSIKAPETLYKRSLYDSCTLFQVVVDRYIIKADIWNFLVIASANKLSCLVVKCRKWDFYFDRVQTQEKCMYCAWRSVCANYPSELSLAVTRYTQVSNFKLWCTIYLVDHYVVILLMSYSLCSVCKNSISWSLRVFFFIPIPHRFTVPDY